MASLILLTTGVLTWLQIRAEISANQRREQMRAKQIGQLLQRSQFPLTRTVLENMRSLSGAEFLLTDEQGRILAGTDRAPDHWPGNLAAPRQEAIKTDFNGQAYFYLIVATRQPDQSTGIRDVHIFLPQPSDATVWWESSRMPLLTAAMILLVALLMSLAIAGQVTRPLGDLKEQALRISQGDLRPVTTQTGYDDEIRDLQQAVNEMVLMLKDRDQRVRDNERLQALIQLGDGIAHHLRNAATGCRMAIDLMASEDSELGESENYRVAVQQLEVMNRYIRKFLLESKGHQSKRESNQQVDLVALLRQVCFSLKPTWEHLGVDVQVDTPGTSSTAIDPEDAEQLMVNLIGNAIDAASATAAARGQSKVSIKLLEASTGVPKLVVSDTGAGPPAEIAAQIFEPFVTGKPEGTGLGLALVRDIADRIGGQISWTRQDEWTTFEFVFGKQDRSDREA